MHKASHLKSHTGASVVSPESRQSTKAGEDRRVFPRVDLQLSAEITGEHGASAQAELRNLSRGGVALSINAANGLRVFPEGQIRPGKAIGLRFDLALAGKDADVVQAAGRVVWSQRVDKDLFVIGIEFTAFQGDSGKRIERYMLECMRAD